MYSIDMKSVSSVQKKSRRWVYVLGGILIILVCSAIAYFIGRRGATPQSISPEQIISLPSIISTPEKAIRDPLFSGKFGRLSKNLHLFKFSEVDAANGLIDNFAYYEAGVFLKGELSGYTRIVALRPSEGPGEPFVYILATKDFTQYILDDPDMATTKYKADDWQNPFTYIDKTKVTSIKIFDTEQPTVLQLDSQYALYKEKFPIDIVQRKEKDANGNFIYDTLIDAETSGLSPLTSPFSTLSLYMKPVKQISQDDNTLSEADRVRLAMHAKYIIGETQIYIFDSVGLPLLYALTTSENIQKYPRLQEKYIADSKVYDEKVKLFQDKKISEYPKSPEYVYPPNLGFNGRDVQGQKTSVYSTYATAVPGACAMTLNTHILKVSDTDLELFGNVGAIELFRLKDIHHPLYTLAYKNKMDYYDQDASAWDQVNKGMKKPSLDEYIEKNPLLFMKDHWGRWVAVGEYDIKLPGGCGKPVIYLYPETPTDVSVLFQNPMQFTVNIPTYDDGWLVTAYPDGSLVNRKPTITNCQTFDDASFGSEYAKDACKTNTYPYLYWAGNVMGKQYPSGDDGFIVERASVRSFLDQTLTHVGLKKNEILDFLSYWVPSMLKYDAPWYKIRFLQTRELNTLFPMTVLPVPDTIFRIFLDYEPLDSKPTHIIAPQTLDRFNRRGFTLVEWGGLKYP